jgi:small-conductance mechanosensitive channel
MKFRNLFILISLFCLFNINQVRAQSVSTGQVDSIKLNIDVNDTLKTATTDTTSGLEKLSLREKMGGPPPLSEIISIRKIFWSIVLIIIGYLGIRIASRAVEIFAEKNPRYRFTIKGVVPIIKIFGWMVIIIMIIAGVFKPPAATVLAFAASIGVAIGFASQDILKNIFGGITILFDRPFNVGDKIEIGKYYGEVVEIGLRSTRLITPDDSMVTVPNSELMNQSLANSNSGESNCQVVTEIYLPISIDTAEIRELVQEAVSVSKYVYLKKPVVILFSHEIKEKRSYMKMKVKAYVFDIRDEFKFKSDMTEIIMRELVSKGIIKD